MKETRKKVNNTTKLYYFPLWGTNSFIVTPSDNINAYENGKS